MCEKPAAAACLSRKSGLTPSFGQLEGGDARRSAPKNTDAPAPLFGFRCPSVEIRGLIRRHTERTILAHPRRRAQDGDSAARRDAARAPPRQSGVADLAVAASQVREGEGGVGCAFY